MHQPAEKMRHVTVVQLGKLCAVTDCLPPYNTTLPWQHGYPMLGDIGGSIMYLIRCQLLQPVLLGSLASYYVAGRTVLSPRQQRLKG